MTTPAEDVEQLIAFATGSTAPAQWRDVVELVNAGQLAWSDIASGKAATHPAVFAALDATARQQIGIAQRTDEDFSKYSYVEDP
ncbi:hypothetical protein EV191_103336 [Tamaricihabitans halophyticus]|uniref:Uncharacterized protein n=1 Tax=Tamaricihabitans halophyticus TaxID=1262583 RepID=A0A4R2R424_9PSEU|nr:hypothetical protein [Tamaricihabitans halophyticus]TCP54291.1 hypothetical protein EV191_103336 [Tamaricihabitans halophyticus]